MDLSVRDTRKARAVVALPDWKLEAEREWVTYRAQPGRCPRTGRPPPAVEPTRAELRHDLTGKLAAGIAHHVRTLADRRLSSWRADANRAEAEGRVDDAVEGYVRVVLASGAQDDPALTRLNSLLRRFRGIDDLGEALR